MSQQMPEYQVFIDERKGTFYAYSPDLPGCDATGTSEDEAYKKVCEKIDRYVAALAGAGIQPPEPAPIRSSIVKIEDGIGYGIVADPENSLYDLLTGSIKAKNDHSRAGGSEKHRKGIMAAIIARLTKDPAMTNRQLWDSFAESFDDAEESFEAGGTQYLVYRSSRLHDPTSGKPRLVQRNDRTGKDSAITYRSFETYVAKARKKLRK